MHVFRLEAVHTRLLPAADADPAPARLHSVALRQDHRGGHVQSNAAGEVHAAYASLTSTVCQYVEFITGTNFPDSVQHVNVWQFQS